MFHKLNDGNLVLITFIPSLCLSCAVVNVSWETPEIVTPETSGTVMVCFTTDKGSSTAYTVTVTSEGATSNPAICKMIKGIHLNVFLNIR